MSGITETGHAKNVANFEQLISFCTGYGAIYNPGKANIQLSALNTKFSTCKNALLAAKVAKTNFDNSSNTREAVFSSLKKLATKIVNSLEATDATEQTMDDAKTVNRKIQGKRAGRIADGTIPIGNPALEPTVKSISVSQQSYDSLIDHFTKLIQIVTSEPSYHPNEAELNAVGLNAHLTSLQGANSLVINSTTDFSNARITRDSELYDPKTGLVELSLEVKAYIKSLYGTSSSQYKQVSGVKFFKIGKN